MPSVAGATYRWLHEETRSSADLNALTRFRLTLPFMENHQNGTHRLRQEHQAFHMGYSLDPPSYTYSSVLHVGIRAQVVLWGRSPVI